MKKFMPVALAVRDTTKKIMLVTLAMILTLSAFSLPSVMGSAQVRQAYAQGNTSEDEDFAVF